MSSSPASSPARHPAAASARGQRHLISASASRWRRPASASRSPWRPRYRVPGGDGDGGRFRPDSVAGTGTGGDRGRNSGVPVARPYLFRKQSEIDRRPPPPPPRRTSEIPTMEGNLDAVIESLLNMERQCRLAGDVAGTRKAAVDIVDLCFKDTAWKTLNDQIVVLSKRWGQLKQANINGSSGHAHPMSGAVTIESSQPEKTIKALCEPKDRDRRRDLNQLD